MEQGRLHLFLGGDENTELDGPVKVGGSLMLTQAEERHCRENHENLGRGQEGGRLIDVGS